MTTMEVAMKKVMKVPQVPKRDNPVTVLSVEKKAPAVSMPPSIDEFIERLTIGEAIHRLAAVESWTQTEGATA